MSPALARLDEVIVRVTTWVAAAFLFLVLAGWLASGDSMLLWRAGSPLVTSSVGFYMLIRKRPRALVQLVSAGSAFVLYTGFVDTASQAGALMGVVSMGIVGALLTRAHGPTFMVITAVVIAGVSMWWHDGGGSLAVRAPDALLPTLMFLFTGSLVMWLKRGLERESDAHRHAAQALATSEERFRLAFEMAAAGVAIVSTEDHTLIRANQAASDLLGYTETELIGTRFDTLVHPDDRAASVERARRLIDGESPHERAAIRYIRKDGAIAHALVTSAIVRETHDGPRHIIAHAVDLTDQVMAERRLLDLLASKDQLIASVSHELRTPLTGMVGYAEVLHEQINSLEPTERLAMLDQIVAQGNDLTHIVEDLLVAARADIDALHVRSEPVDLGDEVDQVVANLARHTPTDRIDIGGPAGEALGDSTRVRQILRNLVTNAMRYGGDHVWVEFDAVHPWSRVRVSDNGPGIPVEHREKIFDAYHRAHEERGLTGSVGLGLTVARTLARLMGGDLSYRYEEGRSTFELRLPAVDASPSPVPQLDAASSAS